ncbi:hypothetical protein B296_00028545 [Ensete ventricosum]|uniref:ESCRT-II complex subunit VPS36 n=1 Tax=Ensete ventricosum TaxID=4639 RepID=A0A427AMH5_ENSVE|nr:hypothetical protein B296_00028545 [Ensete ventricosum]
MLPSIPHRLRRGECNEEKTVARSPHLARFSSAASSRGSPIIDVFDSRAIASLLEGSNVFARIASLAQKPDALRTGISPSDAALTLGIAPALAKEHLLTAESKGLIANL